MAQWWEADPLAPGATATAPAAVGDKWWEADKPAAVPLIPSQQPGQGSILPLRRGATGAEFDPTAGILGSLLRALTTPGDIAAGNIPTPYSPGASATPSQDVLSRATETAGLISPMSPSYRAGARFGTVTPLADDAWMPGWRGNLTKPPIAPPPAADIKAAENTGYTAVRQSGLESPSNLISNLATDIRTGYGARFSPESAKNTFSRLDLMADPKLSGTSMTDLLAHRDDLSSIISKGGPDAVAAHEARTVIDQFIDNLGAGNTRAAPGMTPTMLPEEVSATLQTARGNARARMVANEISGELSPGTVGFLERAEARAGIPGRQSVDTQLRNRAGAMLESNAEVSSLLPDERKAVEMIRDGTATRNTLAWFGRKLSNLSSQVTGGGLGGLAGLLHGGTLGDAALGVLALQGARGAAGAAARGGANALARRQTLAAEELVRRNSPLGQSLLDVPLSYSPGTGRDAAIMRALLPDLLTEPPSERRLPPGFI